MHNTTNPHNIGSQSTLIQANVTHCNDLDVVVFGELRKKDEGHYTAAIMVGLTPAVEGDPAPSPEGAMRKLLAATCELLKVYIPKVGTHQRNIHGGGVFDEVSADLATLALHSAFYNVSCTKDGNTI